MLIRNFFVKFVIFLFVIFFLFSTFSYFLSWNSNGATINSTVFQKKWGTFILFNNHSPQDFRNQYHLGYPYNSMSIPTGNLKNKWSYFQRGSNPSWVQLFHLLKSLSTRRKIRSSAIGKIDYVSPCVLVTLNEVAW